MLLNSGQIKDINKDGQITMPWFFIPEITAE